MARILLVEDDASLARGLMAGLRGDGYAVDLACDGEDALMMAGDEPFALMVLDANLPTLSGFEVLRRLRASGCQMPVLMLTARDALSDRVAGLDLGADDYLVKPAEPEEFSARCRALLRRSGGDPSPIIQIGNLELDRSRCIAWVCGVEIDLRRREWAVLERLVANRNKVINKNQICSEIFSYDEIVAPNAIEVYITRLRRKLGPHGPTIKNLRGLGYILEDIPAGEF